MPRGAEFRAGMIRGTVEAAAGAVSFDPVRSASSYAPGISAAIYGDQNVSVRLYSSDFAIDSTSEPGTRTWSFRVGLRNYLDYPIGSNQGGALPYDTLGVYVAIVADPTVISTSGSCTGAGCNISLVNPDGVGSFTAPGQKYFYWPERLAAKQPVAGADTTSTRRLWQFSGPASITGFSFVVMVRAAWPPPYDASWDVFYDAASDSLPDSAAEPRWKRLIVPGLLGGSAPGTETWSSGGLVMTATNSQSLYMYRSDSLGPGEPAYIEARLRVDGSGSGNSPGAVFGLQGSGHLAAVGVMDGEVGFVQREHITILWFDLGYRWSFVGPTHELDGNGGQTDHIYRLRRFGSDSVTLEMDDARVLGRSLSELPQVSAQLQDATTFFGVTNANSTWSHITYNLGTTQP